MAWICLHIFCLGFIQIYYYIGLFLSPHLGIFQPLPLVVFFQFHSLSTLLLGPQWCKWWIFCYCPKGSWSSVFFFFLIILYSLSSSDWVNCIDRSSSWLILSFGISTLLLNPYSNFFSGGVFWISQFYTFNFVLFATSNSLLKCSIF